MTAPTLQWILQQPSFNTLDTNIEPSITTDSAGNSYIAYYGNSNASGQSSTGLADVIVFKVDTLGNVLWVKQQASFNTLSNDIDPSITVDSNGNVYVTYSTAGEAPGQSLTGSSDIVVFKLDNNGNTLWIKEHSSFNTSGADTVPAISVDAAGNTYISHQSTGAASGQTLTGSFDIVTFKLDTNGNTQWVRESSTFNTTGGDQVPTIVADAVGNSYTAYYTPSVVPGQSDTGVDDIVVYKLDTNGNTVWVRQNSTFNSTSNGLYPSIALDGSGNVYVAYESSGVASGQTYMGGGYDIVVFKLNSSGTTQWVRESPTFNTSDQDLFPSIVADLAGNTYIAYQTIGTVSGGSDAHGLDGGGSDIVVFKLDTNGTTQWTLQQPVFNTLGDSVNAVVGIDASGNVYVSYQANAVSSGQVLTGTQDIILFKLDQNQ